jgi:hypothetical protein
MYLDLWTGYYIAICDYLRLSRAIADLIVKRSSDAMWVRRSPDEIALIERRKQRKRFSPVGAFLLTLVLLLIVSIIPRHSPSHSFFMSPAFPLTFLIVFGLFYISHVMLGRYELFGPGLVPPAITHRTMICPLCRTIQFDTESHICRCGGYLEDLDHWRWTDENKSVG